MLNNVRITCGTDGVKLCRRIEVLHLKIGRNESHIRFNLQCKHTNTIPKYAQIKKCRAIDSEECRKIIRKAELDLLSLEIKKFHINIKNIKEEIARLRNSDTFKLLDAELVSKLVEHWQRKKDYEFNIYKERQKEKYRRLKEVQHPELTCETNPEEQDHSMKEKWVKNISSKPLTDSQINLLQKGAGFAITPRDIPVEEYLTSTEEAGKYMSKAEHQALRASIVEIIQTSKPPKRNLTYKEREALKELRNDNSITIVPADKGKCLVVGQI